jgi:hypothetical protein
MMTDKLIYKYLSFNENSLAIFINCELFFAKAESFNDPFDTQLNLYEALKAFIQEYEYALPEPDEESAIREICSNAAAELNRTGILSLSKIDTEILMWSHYADHHKGFCLGFSLVGLGDDFSTVQHPAEYDVHYDEPKPFSNLLKIYQRSNLKPFQFLDADVYKILIEYKHENWRYEKELRFLYPKIGSVQFDPANLKTISYGIKTPHIIKQTLNSLILSKSEFGHVRQYQMKRKSGELGINPEPITEDDFSRNGDGE